MSQQAVSVQSPPDVLQQLQSENAELQRHLAAQKVVIASLERRVGRSLASLGIHIQQLTATPETGPTWHDHLNSVQSEVDCLCDLLSDTLLLQKLEAGKVDVAMERLDLTPVLIAATRHWLEVRGEQPVRLVCKIDPALPIALANQDLMEAVLTDLLARGLKYSDVQSAVLLTAESLGDRVHLTVTAQRFAPPGNRDFATEIVLCCRRIEVQGGSVTCCPQPDGSQRVTIALQTSD